MHELSPGSPLRSVLSSAVIKLNEDGVIMQLKEKWWKGREAADRAVT